MTKTTKTLIALCFLTNAACASTSTKKDYTQTKAYMNRPTLKSSGFNIEKKPLTQKQINTLLSSKVRFKKSLKVAVAKLAHRNSYYSYTGYKFNRNVDSKATKENVSALNKVLNSKGRIKDISYIPEFLMPLEKNFKALRDVAAMMQADLLLIIKSKSDSDYKYKFFDNNKAKAVSTLEAVVVDVRSGTIPFTSIATAAVESKTSKKDFSKEEFKAKVILAAQDKALGEIVTDMGNYFY